MKKSKPITFAEHCAICLLFTLLGLFAASCVLFSYDEMVGNAKQFAVAIWSMTYKLTTN